MRRVCEEGDYYLDEYRLFKRSCRQGYKDKSLVVKSDNIRKMDLAP